MTETRLFNPAFLKEKLQQYTIDNKIFNEITKIAEKWSELTSKNEDQYQTLFLQDFFHKILGYDYDVNKKELWWEKKTNVDSKKPDGILGYDVTGASADIRAVIELKGISSNLDKKQNRVDFKGTPVEQAFGYVSGVGKQCEWVIVSNYKEIRLYKSNYRGNYHTFEIADLTNLTKAKEFYLLLSKGNLFTSNYNKSKTHQLLEDSQTEEQNIEKKFYKEYSGIRISLWNSLCANNPDKDKKFLLTKTQKILDRVLFICFCEDLYKIPHNTIANLLASFKKSLNRNKNLWHEAIGLFDSIDKGLDDPKINAFNGGLFHEDAELEKLIVPKESIEEVLNISTWDFNSQLSVNILGHILEQSITDLEQLHASIDNQEYDISQGKRKKDGVFYTPEYITKYIVDEAIGGWLEDVKQELNFTNLPEFTKEEFEVIEAERGNTKRKYSKELKEKIDINLAFWNDYANKLKNISVIDPACGSGAFLIQVLNYLTKQWEDLQHEVSNLGGDLLNTQFNYNDILKNNIYGVDLNPESVQITKLSIWLKTANGSDKLTTLDDNIKCGNSLIDDEAIDEKAFKWEKEFAEVMRDGGFDVVVGNPPYVRQERFKEIKEALAQKYPNVYSGVADLYCYFFELAHNIMKSGGNLGFIISNKWMRANYGEGLRKFLLENTKIASIIDLGGQSVFEGVGVDANIITFRKETAQDYSLKISNNLDKFTTMSSSDLSLKCFNIDSNDIERGIKEKMEQVGTPLKDWDIKINYGIKTGFNEAFIIDTATKEAICKQDPKSAEIIKPILRGRDIYRYGYEWAGLWVIIVKFNFYKELMKNYPAVYSYLLQYEVQLKKRGQCKYSRDKKVDPTKDYQGQHHWLELDNNPQDSYLNLFEGEKVVWQEMTNKPCFTIVKDEKYISNTGYLLVGEKLQYISSILNSKIIDFYMKKISFTLGTDGKRWIKQFVDQLPIPKISEEAEEPFIDKADEMLSLTAELQTLSSKFIKLLSSDLAIAKITKKLGKWHELTADDFIAEIVKQNKTLPLAKKSEWLEYFEAEKAKATAIVGQITATDRSIDEMVYGLYGLSEEEVKIVEGME